MQTKDETNFYLSTNLPQENRYDDTGMKKVTLMGEGRGIAEKFSG